MADLGPFEEPVGFDWAAAERLAAELRATASLLESQVPSRQSFAAEARRDWLGSYAVKFDARIGICTGDAGRFAQAMQATALKVEELARLAHEEQHRRDLAKEWKRKHDVWKQQRDHRSGLSTFADTLSEGVGLSDSHEPKPPDPPKSQTRYTSDAPPATSRA